MARFRAAGLRCLEASVAAVIGLLLIVAARVPAAVARRPGLPAGEAVGCC